MNTFNDNQGQVAELSMDEMNEVGGGVPFLAIPIAVGLALLASEYFHHHA